MKMNRMMMCFLLGAWMAKGDCIVWSAEDAVAGKADGEEITQWLDSSGTHSADYDGIKGNGANPVTKPTVELGAFGKRAGVNFDHSALRILAADNPLAGCTNWTVCVVMKTTTPAAEWAPQRLNWYAMRAIVGREEGGTVNDWALVINDEGRIGGGLGILWGSDTCLLTQTPYTDGIPHVLFYSLDSNGIRTVCVDEEIVSNTVSLDSKTKSPRNRSNIYLGVQNIAGSKGPWFHAFVGSVAEFRFYPDQVLTEEERASIGRMLAVKYGAPHEELGTLINVR